MAAIATTAAAAPLPPILLAAPVATGVDPVTLVGSLFGDPLPLPAAAVLVVAGKEDPSEAEVAKLALVVGVGVAAAPPAA